ncbi:hypothetical protein ACFWZ3_17215 [Frateuria sp. GZRR35]|uniref:hypothetical protein n=1 Tax=Frateuria sp. GZRR35 TaxID=3351536 RepID=UPI003EDB97A9
MSQQTEARRRFCAEPSPDVFSVVAQSLSAGGTLSKGADPATLQAALNAAFSSSEQGSTIPRTQTVNMLRELMYRTCERYLSGGYDAAELSVQAVRDQRLMVSILAIEQLTGAVAPKPVVIAATGMGATGASGEAVVRLDDARKARDKAAANAKIAAADYENVNGESKVCDAIKDKPATELTDDQKTKVEQCAARREAQTKALADQTSTAAAYEELSSLARSGGVTVATSTSATAPGGIDRADVNNVSDVGKRVQEIVAANFNDGTEVMLFCLRMLNNEAAKGASPPQQADLKKVCVDYLGESVRAQQLRQAEGVARSARIEHEGTAANFEKFWTPARQSLFADAAKRATFAADLRPMLAPSESTIADCFAAATTKAQVETCFVALSPAVQRELTR